MAGVLEVILVKELEYQRIDCTCGIAVMPKDPTPDVTEAIKKIARKFGARFRILDTRVSPETIGKYHIKHLPSVLIEEKIYPADAEIVDRILTELII